MINDAEVKWAAFSAMSELNKLNERRMNREWAEQRKLTNSTWRKMWARLSKLSVSVTFKEIVFYLMFNLES